MKNLLLLITLMLSVECHCQEKKTHQSFKTVNVYWLKETNEIYLVDSIGKQIHPTLKIIRIDSMEVKGEHVLLIYGSDALISYGKSYMAYDTRSEGFVYLKPKEE